MAKDGIFNLPNYSPIESVGKTNVYEVLFYLMTEKEEQESLL